MNLKIWAVSLFTIGLAFAAIPSQALEYGMSRNAVYGAAGFTGGGFALGADYENMSNHDYGIGGLVRIYQKDANRGYSGYTIIGGFIRPHFAKRRWDMYMSPGLSIISVSDYRPGKNATLLGASLGLGLMYDLTSSASLGVESMQTHGWFNSDHQGLLMQDLMFRFRVLF